MLDSTAAHRLARGTESIQIYLFLRLRGATSTIPAHSTRITYVYPGFRDYFEPYRHLAMLRCGATHPFFLRDRRCRSKAFYPFTSSSRPPRSPRRFLTMCYLPGQHTPEHECWYINQGAVDKNFYDTGHFALETHCPPEIRRPRFAEFLRRKLVNQN